MAIPFRRCAPTRLWPDWNGSTRSRGPWAFGSGPSFFGSAITDIYNRLMYQGSEGEIMNRNAVLVFAAMLALTLAANAGSISGKVSGVNGESVVYLDTVQGKTFPAPSEHPVMDQKGLLFQPHILVVQQGTTVDFLNSDKVAHNVFWPSIMQGTKKLPGKNMGTWP